VLRKRHSQAPYGGTRATGSAIVISTPVRAVPVCLRQRMPAAGIYPVVDIARSHLGAMRKIEGSAHRTLDATIAECRFGKTASQITVVRPFHECVGWQAQGTPQYLRWSDADP
jgi:hypothetical protein